MRDYSTKNASPSHSRSSYSKRKSPCSHGHGDAVRPKIPETHGDLPNTRPKTHGYLPSGLVRFQWLRASHYFSSIHTGSSPHLLFLLFRWGGWSPHVLLHIPGVTPGCLRGLQGSVAFATAHRASSDTHVPRAFFSAPHSCPPSAQRLPHCRLWPSRQPSTRGATRTRGRGLARPPSTTGCCLCCLCTRCQPGVEEVLRQVACYHTLEIVHRKRSAMQRNHVAASLLSCTSMLLSFWTSYHHRGNCARQGCPWPPNRPSC